MKLRRLTIKNFRGIRKLEWTLSGDMVCLIGPGDSTKSTILLALEYLFSPSWNLSVSDVDFYQMNVGNSIEIIAVVTELPEALVSEDKFGLNLGFWNPEDRSLTESQDNNAYQKALQIKLEISSDLEPEWSVVAVQDSGREPKKITAAYRRMLGVARIGNYVDADLAWGRNSALSHLTQKEDFSQIPMLLADAERNVLAALKNMDFSALTQAVQDANATAQELGVDAQHRLHPGMNPMRVSLRQGAISLFDGDLPFSLRGAGSRRLMAMAVHKASVPDGAIILIDEIENSLEPYRLRHLIRQLRPKSDENHQVIFTTHSSVAVVECRAEELFVVRSNNGKTIIKNIDANFQDIDFQGVVRSIPEAFLSKKVVICEGKTEAGLLIALDKMYWENKHQAHSSPFRYQTMAEAGVAPIESPKSGGSEAPKYAVALARLGYCVAYFGDSDRDLNPSEAQMKREGVDDVFLWEGNLEVERRLCLDLPWEGLKQLVELAIELEDSAQSVWDKIYNILSEKGHNFTRQEDLDDLAVEIGENNLREGIGIAADKGKWFKRRDKGEKLGTLLARHLDAMQNTPTANTLCALERWCYGG